MSNMSKQTRAHCKNVPVEEFMHNYIRSLLACFATPLTWNIQWVVLKSCSVLSEMDECESDKLYLLYVAGQFGNVWLVALTGYCFIMFKNNVPPSLNTYLNQRIVLKKSKSVNSAMHVRFCTRCTTEQVCSVRKALPTCYVGLQTMHSDESI